MKSVFRSGPGHSVCLWALICSEFLQASCNVPAPEIEWEKSYGGTQRERATCIRQTSDGGYVVTGIGGSFDGDETGNHGFLDFWVLKLSEHGDLQWQRSYGGSYFDEPFDIEQTSHHGYVLAGDTYSNNGDVKGKHQRADGWMIRIDSTGQLMWQKQIGGRDRDFIYSVKEMDDGDFIAAGISDSKDDAFSNNHGKQDVWIFKLDQNGNLLWQKLYGSSENEDCRVIQKTQDGGFIVAGAHALSKDTSDFLIMKFDRSGALQWQKSYSDGIYNSSASICQTPDGGFAMAGFSYSSTNGNIKASHGFEDYCIIKLDSMGNLMWQKDYGGSLEDEASDIILTRDDGFIVSGHTASVDGDVTGNHGLEDAWIIRLNSNGKIIWKKSLGGSGDDWANSLVQSSDGGYAIAGWSDSKDGDVTGNHGGDDFWIVKLKPDPVK